MKRILSLILVLIMTAAMFAGCSKGGNDGSSANSESPVPPEVTSTPETDLSGTDDLDGTVDSKLTEIHEGVKEAYGDAYVPSSAIDGTMLGEVYGVNMDNVESFIAEGPMISAHVDTYVSIKAKEGKGEEVEKELKAYRDKVVSDSMQYPMNQEKVNASQVHRDGDYVFFVMLGGFGDDLEEGADMVKYAEEQTRIGLDKIKSFFE